jgi:hypothetical protein
MCKSCAQLFTQSVTTAAEIVNNKYAALFGFVCCT